MEQQKRGIQSFDRFFKIAFSASNGLRNMLGSLNLKFVQRRYDGPEPANFN